MHRGMRCSLSSRFSTQFAAARSTAATSSRGFAAAAAQSHSKFGVLVLGGSGYTGAELIRLLAAHPYAEVGLSTPLARSNLPA